MAKEYVFDIECNGFNPDRVHCMVVNGEEVDKSFFEDLTSDDLLIGHNIIRFDVPILERLLKIKIKAQLVDTLALSWYLTPNIGWHGLAQWGERFGIPKPKVDDWDNLSHEEYLHRCKEDVAINTKLWSIQSEMLNKIYVGKPEPLIKYLAFKMRVAMLQERSKWKLDVDKANELFNTLEEKHDAGSLELSKIMPMVDKIAKRKRPKLPFKNDGTLSASGIKWRELCDERGLPYDYDQTIDVVVGQSEPNPSSSSQLKTWLNTLGWEPTTFNYVNEKNIPQIKTKYGLLCPSIERLAVKYPELLVLGDLAVVKHRMAMVKSLLDNVDSEGYVIAAIQGLTNTLRFKHQVCVNLPSARKPYGLEIRALLTARGGHELCGSDMAALEDRVKQHLMWDFDPSYVTEMSTEGFDPHLDLAVSAGAVSEKEMQDYKDGSKTDAISLVRHNYKSGNYALQYGAGIATLSRQLGISQHEAKVISKAYWKRNWSVKAISDSLTVKNVEGSLWQYNEVSKLWYLLRSDKDKFSTCCQGLGTYLFDMWLAFILEDRLQITANFHDEIVIEVREGNRDKCEALLNKAIQKVNSVLQLNRNLEVDIQFGSNYSEIH
jgi:hypothetical protein